MLYDVVEAQQASRYQSAKVAREMQDAKADFEAIASFIQKLGRTLRTQFQSTGKKTTSQPIGDVQTNLR